MPDKKNPFPPLFWETLDHFSLNVKQCLLNVFVSNFQIYQFKFIKHNQSELKRQKERKQEKKKIAKKR